MTKTADELASELEQRVFDLMRIAGTDEAYAMCGDDPDAWDHPHYFPAVAWPVAWLVETIKAAQRDAHTAVD